MPVSPVQKNDAVRQQAAQAIANASRQTGMSFDYLMAQARIESSLNPDAKAATSSAAGLFQFTRQTWLATLAQHGPAHGLSWASQAISQNKDGEYSVADPGLRQQIMNLRYDADASSLMAARFADDNAATLRDRLSIEPEPVDLYLAHFLGAKGATSFLRAWQQDPNQPAAPLFPKAAAANRAIFFGRNGAPASLAEIRNNFAAKMGSGAIAMPGPYGGGAPASAGIASYGGRSAAPSFASNPRESAEAFLRRATIEPMPGKLSMAFAARTYQRLNGSAAA
jgi:Transglycosylase SLT domain